MRPQPMLARRGFTLVELLTVILIIVIVISIVLPALGQVRKSARKTETTTQLNALNSAIAKYVIDNKRTPGYFSAAEMGSADNETQGFSAMQNIMLDLAGGVVKDGTTGEVKVGPRTLPAEKISVLPENIGLQTAGQNIYFTPTAKNWRNIPNSTSTVASDFGNRLSTAENARINELVDAFGTPIIAWALDETVRTPITGPIPGGTPGLVTQFARRNSGVGDQKARFYWASNAAFLSNDPAVVIGRQRRNQAATGKSSIIHGGITPDDYIERPLMGIH
jgi:prepilin-type N-terminal cleavage/methylation domain-containing protein